MAKRKILQESESYSFLSYVEMPYDTDEILAELGYFFSKTKLTLPKTDKSLDKLPELKDKIRSLLPLISLNNETARRETLVAPLLLEVISYCRCQLRIEYPININNWLKGNFDYLLRSQHNLLVVEAKNDDITRGFTQLAVELIALSEMTENQNIFYGTVTTGEIWRFCKLDVQEKQVFQDLSLFQIPDDLEELGQILVGILMDNEELS